MSAPPTIKQTWPVKSEAIWLALFPLLGSAVAYLFEFGYVSNFDVPPSLITIDITRILTATAVLAFIVPLYLILLSYGANYAIDDEPIRKAVGRAIIYACFVLPFALLVPGVTYRWGTVLAVFMWGLLIEFGPALFARNKGATYRERLLGIQMDTRARIRNSETPPSALINQRVVSPVGILFFAGLLVTQLGATWAENRTSYLTLVDRPEAILVGQYGDIAVFRIIDLESKKMINELVVLKIGNDPLRLQRTETGQIQKAK